MRPGGRTHALSVALLYAAFGAVWILLSDTILNWLTPDRDTLLLLGTLKGWLFVLISAVLLYVVVHRTPAWSARTTTAPKTRLPWGVMLVIALAIVAITAATLLQSWHQEHARIEVQLRSIADGKAKRLGDWHQERLHTAGQVQHEGWALQLWQTWLREHTPAARQTLGEQVGRLVQGRGVARIEIFDARGQQQIWPNLVETPPPDPVLVAALQSVRLSRQPQSVGPWRDPSGALRLAFIGLIGPEHTTPALVVLHTDPPPYIHPALKEWPEPSQRSGESFLFKQQGNEVLLLSDPQNDPGAAALRTRPLSTSTLLSAQFLRGEVAAGQMQPGTDYRDVPVFGVILPVPGTTWWVQTKQDRSELLASAIQSGTALTLAGLLGLFSAFAAAYLLLQRRRLAHRASDIAALQTSQQQLSESEARYRLLAENASDAVWLLDVASQRLVYVSPAVERLIGHTAEEMCQMSLADFLAPEDLPRALDWLQRHVQRFNAGESTAASGTLELLHRHKNGGWVSMELSMRLVPDAQGQATQVQGVSRDISERKRAEHQIRMLSQATAQSPVGVLIASPQAVIEYVNPAFEHMSGYSAAELVGQNPRFLQSQHTPRETYRHMWDTLRNGQAWQGELINRHKDGRHYVQAVTIAPLRDARGHVVQYISVQMDITAQRAAEERAEHLIWFDPLTGLPNRQRLLADMGELIQRRTPSRQHGLLLINIDRFKAVNEARGHGTGDGILRDLAERLHGGLQSSDRVAHLNGDEFGLLVQDLPAEHASASLELMQRAQAVHEHMRQAFVAGNVAVVMTVSIGIALLGQDSNESASDVLRRADTALHRAKSAGGQQTAFFDAGMGHLVRERFAIEQDLRRGIEAGELRLYLQAQVDAAGQTVSAEALVRWQHPQQGLVPPALFIPVAEESGLIDLIGRWVLEQVCLRLGELERRGQRLSIAVNISPRQFHQAHFSTEVLSLLQQHGAPASGLVLEITEGVVVQEVDAVVRRMNELTRHGVRFSIDDFGTGYSSLSYLKNLPIHELKIDRSFVQDAPTDPSDAALVEAMLSVARHLRLSVVAEGVETAEQAAFFQRHPQVLMQGYLYGRPVPEDEFLRRWMG